MRDPLSFRWHGKAVRVPFGKIGHYTVWHRYDNCEHPRANACVFATISACVFVATNYSILQQMEIGVDEPLSLSLSHIHTHLMKPHTEAMTRCSLIDHYFYCTHESKVVWMSSSTEMHSRTNQEIISRLYLFWWLSTSSILVNIHACLRCKFSSNYLTHKNEEVRRWRSKSHLKCTLQKNKLQKQRKKKEVPYCNRRLNHFHSNC